MAGVRIVIFAREAMEPVVVVAAGPNPPDLFGRRAVELAWLWQIFMRWQALRPPRNHLISFAEMQRLDDMAKWIRLGRPQ